MKFANLEELLQYIIKNDVNIAETEFPFGDVVETDPEAGDPTATPDVIAEPPAEVEGEEEDDIEILEGVIHFASGDVQLELDAEGNVIVESFTMAPNSCGTGQVVLAGRTVHLNMCEMDGKTMAYADVTLNGVRNHKTALSVRAKS